MLMAQRAERMLGELISCVFFSLSFSFSRSLSLATRLLITSEAAGLQEK